MEPTPPTAVCQELHDDLAVLAIGALTGHDRSRILAHLQDCPSCPPELEELSAAADALATLIPEAVPTEGFSDRTMAVIRAEQQGRQQPLIRRLAAVAAVVVVLAVGGAVGAALAPTSHPVPANALWSGPLHSTQGAQGTVVLLSSGQKGWLVMNLYDAPTSGTVTCTLALDDGTHRSVGEFSLAAGYGSWTAPIPVPASSVRWVNVVSASGTTVASARITARA
jgi:hypothetical protein